MGIGGKFGIFVLGRNYEYLDELKIAFIIAQKEIM